MTLWTPKVRLLGINTKPGSRITHIYLGGCYTSAPPHAATQFHSRNSKGVLKLARKPTLYYPR